MDQLRQQMNARLAEALGDETRRQEAEVLVACVCDLLESGDASAEAITSAVKAALAPALEETEAAIEAAEQMLRGRS